MNKKVKGLWIIGTNPLVSFPNREVLEVALERLDLLVVQDGFETPTTVIADVVLPAAIWGEKDGTYTNSERRVSRVRAAVEPPGGARPDFDIFLAIAERWGCRDELFAGWHGPRDAFEEWRRISAGRPCDYSGITYERIEQNFGVFWPCPSDLPEGVPMPGPQGTPRLFEPGSWNPVAKGAGPFYFPDGRARLNVTPYVGPAEDVDEAFPIILTTGRVVSQFLSGNQTRRIGPLVDHCPEPRIELHPRLAGRLGIADGDWTRVESRRGHCTLRASVVTTIRPDTVFIPYHWPGRKSANQLTISAQDPISKIPEYKVCAVRVRKADARPDHADALEPQQ
jgi:assimilatory nitrate reductase catalytic subunit